GPPLHTSTSHSADRVTVALTTDGPIGIDVEAVPTGTVDDLARSALTEREQDLLRAFSEEEKRAVFAEIWVRKEAALKATGLGLRISPTKVEVSGPGDPPALLDWPLDIPPENVCFRSLSPGPGYAAAVAVIAGGRAIEAVEFHVPTARPDFADAAPAAA
ncbi:4'-phosphopantetheinyl transferase superfamily protein, partial [Nonomuraea sp. MG754425]|uniref:4'-phosphopantetheinyl transferase family protein n=1 Tax=Nonomuraea sp. MG754425 TaxID=2570319 RepID=UPI001F0208DF